MKKSVCLMFLGMLLLPQISHAVPLTAEHLYTFARQKNEKLLDKYSKYIDLTNKNNDTALCISVKQRDRDSFELLKDYGASTKVDCLQKMLKKSVVKQDNTSAIVSDSEGEFLGMGLKGWGITGLAVAGIAAASSGGGGGGGSSSGSNITEDEESVVLNCINGIQVGDACQCNAGYIGELCENKAECNGYYQTCPDGYEKGTNICQSGEDLLYKCDVINICEGFDYTSCPTGYSASATCKSGETFKYQCNNCAEGYNKDASGNCTLNKGENIAGLRGSVNNSEVYIENFEYSDIYGMFSNGDAKNADANVLNQNHNAEGYLKIKNKSNGDVYGIFGINSYNAIITTDKNSTGNIEIDNDGDGTIYGIYSSKQADNSLADNKTGDWLHTQSLTANANVNVNNRGNGSIYGIYSGKDAYNAHTYNSASFTWKKPNSNGIIKIYNLGDGDVYGIYSVDGNIYNSLSSTVYLNEVGKDHQANGVVYINNKGNGNVFGLFSKEGKVSNTEIYAPGNAEGYIELLNTSFSKTIGIYGKEAYNGGKEKFGKTKSLIKIANLGNGMTIGIYGIDTVNNSDEVIIHNLGQGTAIGLYANGGIASNSGNIIITRDEYIDNKATDEASDDETYTASTEKGGLAIGIYGESGSNINNSGAITISGADTSYGIYAEDDTVTVSNTGTISIDGDTNHANAIKLNGGKLFQDGELVAQNLALNDFGGDVIASSNSKFVAEDKISGDLSVSADVVQNGFDKTYTSKDVISAKDVNELNLSSKSALFDAKLENDSDIVMEMKEFGDVVEDKSIAGFLSDNYSNQNNEKLFNNLKGIENAKSLNSALNDMTGKDMFNRLAFEDLTMAREFNFDLNNKLFNNKEENLTTSGSISPWMFSGASDSQTRYSLNNMTIGNNTIGLAVALTDVNTNDGNGKNARNDKMYQMAMPVGYSAYGFDFITTPSVGYSYGTYNRLGYNNTNYKGTLEKQTFGLMNEARYPFMMAGWNLNLALEFNVMGYRVSGDEGSKEFGLNIAKQDSFSVEAGFGMYANKDIDISKDSKLKLYNGVAFYKEFADPYKMKVGMNGMSGTYTLRDNDRSKNRAVVRTGFDYTSQDLSLYGSLSSYIDHELQTNADIGLKYNF